jgi:hypothetical protein
MGAGVVEGMQRAVAIAIEEQRPAAHLPRDEASGRRYLGGVAEIEPAAVEDPFALRREGLLRDEDVAINAGNASGMRSDDQRRPGARPDGSFCHRCLPGSGRTRSLLRSHWLDH